MMHKYHFPRAIRTQGHHKYPIYLQEELWGEGNLRHKEIIWLCGTCHDNLHAWLDHLLNRAYMPPKPGRMIRQEAEFVANWYDSVKVVAEG
jgi:hypothetical protein